jgi:hypothetical protein
MPEKLWLSGLPALETSRFAKLFFELAPAGRIII